eukprot:TRINITY_DN12311_c0_g1_i2.p1 TRINITY_DN12311_c0_g1~~TRINITY_DN12311_c0_g1_i2.p1  ORF type:complete len:536 (+),score=39.01 TRINITY_DN12311_c0_g1_i2:228-1610(+)
MSLVPRDQDCYQMSRDSTGINDTTSTLMTARYVRLATCVLSQESRLLSQGRLRRAAGYDLSDPWLNDDGDDDYIPFGAPVTLVGTGEPAVYEGPIFNCSGDDEIVATDDSLHRVRYLDSPLTLDLPRCAFIPLPSRPPDTGEWAVAMGLKGVDEQWNGSAGLVVHPGRPPDVPVRRRRTLGWYWVAFATGAVPRTVLLPAKKLAALPSPMRGAPLAPLDTSCAPVHALPPPEHDAFTLFGRGSQESTQVLKQTGGLLEGRDAAAASSRKTKPVERIRRRLNAKQTIPKDGLGGKVSNVKDQTTSQDKEISFNRLPLDDIVSMEDFKAPSHHRARSSHAQESTGLKTALAEERREDGDIQPIVGKVPLRRYRNLLRVFAEPGDAVYRGHVLAKTSYLVRNQSSWGIVNRPRGECRCAYGPCPVCSRNRVKRRRSVPEAMNSNFQRLRKAPKRVRFRCKRPP